jgi:drug/metabolite transporter (DMT)-like permease
MQKFEENLISLNLASNSKKQITNDSYVSDDSKNEYLGFLLNTTHNIIIGFSSFHLKYVLLTFKEDYDIYLFTIFRNISILFISYLLIYQKKIQFIKLESIQNKFWFGIRTFGQFIAAYTFLKSLSYLRTATAVSISTLSPAIVLILGTIILKEKFHIRYVIGFFVCLSGAFLIINSERKIVVEYHEDIKEDDLVIGNLVRIIRLLTEKVTSNEFNVIYGCLWSFINLFIYSMLSTSSKILIKENIGYENQNFFIASVSIILSIILFIFDGSKNLFSLSPLFIGNCFLSGIILFLSLLFLIESLRYIDLNKTTPLSFLPTIITFMLGTVFLNESLFLTDFIGSSIIIIYNILNYIYKI